MKIKAEIESNNGYTTLQEFADKHNLDLILVIKKFSDAYEADTQIRYYAKFNQPVETLTYKYGTHWWGRTPLEAVQQLTKFMCGQTVRINNVEVQVPENLIYLVESV